jgi:hypothetical protein
MRHLRRLLTVLAAAATCGSLVLAVVWALTPSLGAKASPARPVGRRADAAPARRSWRVTLAPSPDDLALAQISFHGSGTRQITKRSLHLAVSGPFGDDYLAAAAIRARTAGGPRALVLLVNRPSPLLDPVSVALALTAWRSLGTPVVRRLADPFTRPQAGSTPALCDLRRHGGALGASELSELDARGAPLAGFSAASAVAQAYDVVCRLPYARSFEQAVEQTSASSSPGPSEPSPSPAPPVGKIPGEGCEPAPDRACPLVVGGTRSAARGTRSAARGAGARRASAGAH